MKKINLTLFVITLFTISLNAQMRVHTNGNVSIQNDSTSIKSKLVIGNGTSGETKVALVAKDEYMGALFIGTGGYNVWTYGIRAIANPTYNMHVGVEGWARLENASNKCRAIGVRGTAGNATNGYNWGVYGLLSGINEGTAIYGTSDPSDWGQQIRGRYAGYFRGNVSVEGNLTATTITTPSDIAYKTNIISLSNNSAISKIQLMNPVIYNLKQPELPQTISESESDTISTTPKLIDENSQEYQKTHYGLIAQELQEVFPELVYENSNGLLNVNYIEIIPILIEAIKEQQEEIDNLKKIINKKEHKHDK